MYTYQSALGFSGGSWEQIDLQNTPLKEVYQTYRRVFISVLETLQQAKLTIDLEDIKTLTYYSNKSIVEFLTDNEEGVLPTSVGWYSLTNISRMNYIDFTQQKFTVRPTILGYKPDDSRPLYRSTELYLDEDSTYTEDNSLAVVSGYLHRIQSSSSGHFIVNGYERMLMTEDSNVGIVDFSKLGKLTQQTIPLEDIHLSDNGYTINTRVDLTNKKVFLSIFGNLLYVSDVRRPFSVNSTTTITLYKNLINWYELLLDVLGTYDIDYLNIRQGPNNVNSLSVEDINLDSTKLNILSGKDCFLVLLDEDPTKPIAVDEEHLHDLGLKTGKYGCERPPAGFLLNSKNQPTNYVIKQEDGLLVVSTNNYRENAYVIETNLTELNHVVDNTRRTADKVTKTLPMRNVSFYRLEK